MESTCSKAERRSKSKKGKNPSSKKLAERKEDENWPRKSRVTFEGYVESLDGSDQGSESGFGNDNNGVGRTKSLTDEDLEELKGCLDLGFGFSYDEIPELCNTLPALELCYSMSQRFSDDASSCEDSSSAAAASSQVANWKISSPGDHPDEVKARLKYWAQAVACTVRLCS